MGCRRDLHSLSFTIPAGIFTACGFTEHVAACRSVAWHVRFPNTTGACFLVAELSERRKARWRHALVRLGQMLKSTAAGPLVMLSKGDERLHE
jgi:hypothetical protein